MDSKFFRKYLNFMFKGYALIFYLSVFLIIGTVLLYHKSFVNLYQDAVISLQNIEAPEKVKKFLLFSFRNFDLIFSLIFFSYLYIKYLIFIKKAKTTKYSNCKYLNALFVESIAGSDIFLYLLAITSFYLNNIFLTIFFSIILSLFIGIYSLKIFVNNSSVCKREEDKFSEECLKKTMDLIRIINNKKG